MGSDMANPDIGFSCQLPDWVHEAVDFDEAYPTSHDKMAVAVGLAQRNVEMETGGPFGAAVFDLTTHRLVAPGVNLVVPNSNPTAHAEIVAISVAGSRLDSYDLGDGGRNPTGLVTSVEPCAMCLGATPWSGVSLIVVGARDEDARAAGFDEGHKPVDWIESLESRGIAVVLDVMRSEATSVLEVYVKAGRTIYNSAPSGSEASDHA